MSYLDLKEFDSVELATLRAYMNYRAELRAVHERRRSS